MLKNIRVLAGSAGSTSAMRRVWVAIDEDSIEKITPYLGSRLSPYRVYTPDGSRVEEVEILYMRLKASGSDYLLHPDDAKRFFPNMKFGDFTPEDETRERGELSNEDPEPEQSPAEPSDPEMPFTVPRDGTTVGIDIATGHDTPGITAIRSENETYQTVRASVRIEPAPPGSPFRPFDDDF